METLIDRKYKEIEEKRSYRFFEKSKTARLKIRVRSLQEDIQEYLARGNVKGICANLVKADGMGRLNEGDFLFNFLQSVTQNLNRKCQGKRYSNSSKLFYEALLYMGGPRIVGFVAANFQGPHTHTVNLWHQESLKNVSLKCSIYEEDFIKLAAVYAEYTKVTGRVPVGLAEDETAIIKRVTYSQVDDSLLGFCGPKENHRCHADFKVFVGNGVQGFENITTAFENIKVANYAKVVRFL